MSVEHGVVAAYARLYGRKGIFEATYRGNVYVIDAITNNPGAGGGVITTRHGELALPVFVPDATRAVVRGVPAASLPAHGIEAVLVSTVHLASQPGTSVVKALGGVHPVMNWAGRTPRPALRR